MTADRGLRARYPDLLDDSDELAAQVAELDAVLAVGEPPAALAESIAAAVRPAERQPIRRGLRPTLPKLSAPIAALLALALLATSAFAVGMANVAINRDAGAVSVQAQMTTIDRSATSAGYTIHIQQAYADANRLIVAYEITPPAGEKDDAVAIVWGKASTVGVDLPWSNNDIENVPPGTRAGDGLMSFETSAVTGQPASLPIKLAVSQLYVVGPNNPKHDPHGPSPIDVNASFDFSVPFNAGRSWTPNVSATWHDRTATVSRVVVAPSETRIYVTLTGVNPTFAELRDSAGNLVKLTTFNSTTAGVVLVFSAPPAAGGSWNLVVGEKPLPNGTFEPQTPVWRFTFPAP